MQSFIWFALIIKKVTVGGGGGEGGIPPTPKLRVLKKDQAR